MQYSVGDLIPNILVLNMADVLAKAASKGGGVSNVGNEFTYGLQYLCRVTCNWYYKVTFYSYFVVLYTLKLLLNIFCVLIYTGFSEQGGR